MLYSIIIPVYNEKDKLKQLLGELEEYSINKHEVIIINDGSDDGSDELLKKCNFINYINLKNNYGKGIAIKVGLKMSKHEKVVIFDGDLEIRTKDISKLMKLNKDKRIQMGNRFKSLDPFKSSFDWGNFIFTTFFNLLHFSLSKDTLCCAKSFYKKDIDLKYLKSSSFEIDVELSSYLTRINRGKKIDQVSLNYKRRTLSQGKKLRISDGWIILRRIIASRLS